MGLNYYNDRVCLNVLGGSLENAKEIYEAAEKYVAVGVLSADYPDVPSAVEDMKKVHGRSGRQSLRRPGRRKSGAVEGRSGDRKGNQGQPLQSGVLRGGMDESQCGYR